MAPMMAPLSPVISPALRDATDLKIEEFERLKSDFTDILHDISARGSDTDKDRDSVLAHLETLLESIKPWENQVMHDDQLSTWTRRVDQAQNDPTITTEKLLSMQRALEEKLQQFMNRLETSSVHIALLKQALRTPEESGGVGTAMSKIALEDEYELVEDDLENVYAAFEENAFAEKQTDTEAITKYLTDLYEDAFGKDNLRLFQQEMAGYANAVIEGSDQLDVELLEWCIEDLIANGMLSPERTSTLRDYLDSDAAMRELTDALNMKSIRSWSWKNAHEGLPVLSRKNSEGKPCIVVEEDLIDMLFLHSLAVRWSMQLRKCLTYFVNLHPRISHMIPSSEEVARREYYLHGPRPKSTPSDAYPLPPPPFPPPPMEPLPPRRRKMYRKNHGPPPPEPYHKARKGKVQQYRSLLFPLRPNTPGSSVEGERQRMYTRHFFVTRLPKQRGPSATKVSELETQTELLRVIAVESKMREGFDGTAHGISANFRAFASSLPHRTILAVLEFLGVTREWIVVFKRFLNAPLVVRGTADQVRTRTAGVSIAHGLETFFGEAILSCLDLAVCHRASTDTATSWLYRLRDHCYLVGRKEQCEAAMKEMNRFADIFGLDLCTKDLFSGETIGFLTFSRNASQHVDAPNKVAISVDTAKATSFARRVKQKLSSCTSIYQWVSTWNTNVGTYAPHLFGPLIPAFDALHLTAITRAYNLVNTTILSSQPLPDHLLPLFPCSLPSTNPPFPLSAFLHLPPSYGGLGLKSPYTKLTPPPPFQSAESLLSNYLTTEHAYYTAVATAFTSLTPHQRSSKLAEIFSTDTARIASAFGSNWATSTTTFPPIRSLTSNREARPAPYHDPYARSGLPVPPSPYGAYPGSSPPPPPPPPPGPWPTTSSPEYIPPDTSHDLIRAPELLVTYQMLGSEVGRGMFRVSRRMMDEINRVGSGGRVKDMYDMKEERWAVGLYGEEAMTWAGGLELWWREGVPGKVEKVGGGERGSVRKGEETDSDEEWDYISDA